MGIIVERHDFLTLCFYEAEDFLLKANLMDSVMLVGRWLKYNSNMNLAVTGSFGFFWQDENYYEGVKPVGLKLMGIDTSLTPFSLLSVGGWIVMNDKV